MIGVGGSFAIGILVCGLGARADGEVRVRLAAEAGGVTISGPSLRVEGEAVPSGSVVVRRVSGGAVEAGPVVRVGPVRFVAAGAVRVGEAAYPGAIVVSPSSGGGLDVINEVPLEIYVERVVSGEVYPDWPAEALKAQAVIARTYALYERDRHRADAFDLEGSVLSQRYAPGTVTGPISEAVRATSGEFLSYRGTPILAAFHSAAGGQTAAAEEVWGEPLPYLRAVDSPDEECPDYFWSYEIERAELLEALRAAGFVPARGEGIRVVERTSSGRVAALEIAGVELSGRSLRQVLGGRAIRSTLFEVRTEGSRVRFLGSGAGHGVGLSQWGARQMARDGRSYREILAHYFPGTSLRPEVAAAARVGGGPP